MQYKNILNRESKNNHMILIVDDCGLWAYSLLSSVSINISKNNSGFYGNVTWHVNYVI